MADTERADGVRGVAPSMVTDDGTFYVVPVTGGYELFTEQSAALDAFGEQVDGGGEIADEDQVREIEIGEAGDNWVIRRLTWQDVARRLLNEQ